MCAKKVCCFGEILWDIFPEYKKLGGAPFNVATTLKGLGLEVEFISRIGKDILGDEILHKVENFQIKTDFIQIDPLHPTGKVNVSINAEGIAKYNFQTDSAWDFIESNEKSLTLVNHSKAFIFGSLVARGYSYTALKQFLNVADFSVFDLNLRAPHYNNSLLIELMSKSHMLKFNDQELYLIANLLNSPFNSMDQHIKFIAKETDTEIICVTMGMFGAVLYHRNDFVYNSGFKIKLVDSVGAGDSFLGTLIYGLLSDDTLQNSLDRACAMGALVCGSAGANPIISKKELMDFMGVQNFG